MNYFFETSQELNNSHFEDSFVNLDSPVCDHSSALINI